MEAFIESENIRLISKIWHKTSDMIYFWGMYTLERFFEIVDASIPEIYTFIDIEKIKENAYKTREDRLKSKPVSDKPQPCDFLPLGFESEIEDIFPDFTVIRDSFQKKFISFPSGIEKTEAWLYPIALDTGADAELEALIYFYSQGEQLVSSDKIRSKWIDALCLRVQRDTLLNKSDKRIIEKASNKELSLMELADIYSGSYYSPEFMSARDEEEDFISATFFRAVDWLQLNEFAPWVETYAQEISTVYQGGVDETYSLFPLFYYCRSDLILKKASKFGLEALLLGLSIGHIETSKPWKRYWEREHKEKGREFSVVDYIPIASILAFAWQRINPTNIKKGILEQSLLLLIQSQLSSGAWPLTSEHLEGSIISTCLAMLALAINKPEGYQRYLSKAKDWLLSQQNEVGCWYISGAPTVMINILCIEAIKLAEGNTQITYKIDEAHTSHGAPQTPDVKGPYIMTGAGKQSISISQCEDFSKDEVKYGIITALPKEYAAVKALIPNGAEFKTDSIGSKKPYIGVLTNLSGQKFPVAVMMSGMGNNQAATRATELVSSFPAIKSIIMCGIAGGIPCPSNINEHVRLGDIVISGKSGIIQYDFVKETWSEIIEKGTRIAPDADLLYAVDILESQKLLGAAPWESNIDYITNKYPHFSRPSECEDVLFDIKGNSIPHPIDSSRNSYPKIFVGPVASANTLLKNPEKRDRLREKYNVKAVEMEASGISDASWNLSIGYLAVRGICDYCDSHKNDVWQLYAAGVAAAYVKSLLETVS